MPVPRSKLFILGDRLDALAKALHSRPDALSFDLEDGVAETGKTAARQAVAELLRATRLPTEVWVRVNGLHGLQSGGSHLVADILALAGTHVDVVNLPKAEAPSDLLLVEQLLLHIEAATGRTRPIRIVPTIESARGLRHAAAIAMASPRVSALQLGAGDLTRSTGIDSRGPGLDAIRAALSLAAAEAGVAALDSTPHGMEDLAAFEADALRARALGFRGKSCMLDVQVPVAHRVFGDARQLS
jgi:citrate lyase subunit beta/citryl-CoA lyase